MLYHRPTVAVLSDDSQLHVLSLLQEVGVLLQHLLHDLGLVDSGGGDDSSRVSVGFAWDQFSYHMSVQYFMQLSE